MQGLETNNYENPRIKNFIKPSCPSIQLRYMKTILASLELLTNNKNKDYRKSIEIFFGRKFI